MTKDTGRAGNYYYLKVPKNRKNSKIVLRDLNSTNQWPTGDNRFQLSNNKSGIFTTSQKADNDESKGWTQTSIYPLSAPSGNVKTESQLNDGESFPGTKNGNVYVVKGYFNSVTGKWSKNPN